VVTSEQIPRVDDFSREFVAADAELRLEQSRIGAWLVLALMPAGMSLDYFVYPSHLWEFAGYRLLADVVVLIALVLHWHPRATQFLPLLTGLYIGAAICAICYMIYVTDGSRSSYPNGLVAILMAIGILLPLTLADAVVICLATIALYAITSMTHQVVPFSLSHFFGNMYFLALGSIISVVAVYFNSRRRLGEFRLKHELEQRNLQLAELDRVKSEFFANVSHELRTPLTLILAPVQDLQRRIEARSTALREPLRIIEQSALRLLRLVNDLLDLIRFEQGEVKLERLPVDATRLVGSLVEQVGHLAKTQQLQLIRDMPAEPLVVDGDAAALERVFINLLSNAIKFTEQGGQIRISADRSNGRALISVADTGIGIDEESIGRIFDRFQQAESSATRRRQGLGLGLALVKDLVTRMAGDVTVSSRRGEGTTFTVSLPLSAEGSNAVEAVREPADAITTFHRQAVLEGSWGNVTPERSGSPDPASLGYTRPTILVVDDEPEMQRYLKAMLEADYNVYQAGDGEAGLAAARELKPDIVLLDLMLPKIDGLAVCATLKRREAIDGMKIVMLTARIDDEAKLRALDNGADDFLTKPFSSLEIKTRLRNLVETGKLERDLKVRNNDLEQVLRKLRETEAQLLHSEKLNSLGTMAAGLLHEINNPINFANTAFTLVLRNPALEADHDLKEMIVDIHDGFRRIQTIVSDLRLFSAPTKAESRKPFRMSTAVQHALRFTASERSGIEIKTELPNVDMVVGNESQIVQVLVNLLLNAARAIRRQQVERRGSISVSGHISGDRLLMRVRDNGCGIAPDRLTRIFDPFYTTGDVGVGTGLGLSISHSIINGHGGTLAVKSEEGEWAELTFDLPLESRISQKGKLDAIASHG
jgi:signal transduction histidine kinase